MATSDPRKRKRSTAEDEGDSAPSESLEMIWFARNDGPVESIPSVSFSRITWLGCQSLDLTSLPDSLGNLVSLKTLFCDGNLITVLPDTLGDLVSLKFLNCTNNRLTALPDSLGDLASLEQLYCYGNLLGALPDTLGNLVALKTLWCQDNRLTALPDSLGNLVALNDFNRINNPFENHEYRLPCSEMRVGMRKRTRWTRVRLAWIGQRDPGSILSTLPVEMIREIASHVFC